MIETIKVLAGYRKCGLKPDEPEKFAVQRYIPTKQEVYISQKKTAMPLADVNANVYPQDQGTDSTCWSYAEVGAQNASLTQKLRMQTVMEGFDFAMDVEKVEPGVIKDGNTLQDTVAKMKQLGVYDKITKKMYTITVQKVDKKDLQTALDNDKIIFTGGLVNPYKMVDADYCWLPGQYGHAFYLCGRSDVGAWAVNSWGDWGMPVGQIKKKTGLFKIRAKDYGKLFTCYAIDCVPMAQQFINK